MIEPAQLLHNMSAPPKSVVKYTGLSRGAATARADGIRVGGGRFKHDGVFGVFVAFRLPEFVRRLDPGSILKHIGVEYGADPEETLLSLIKIRSRQLRRASWRASYDTGQIQVRHRLRGKHYQYERSVGCRRPHRNPEAVRNVP